MLVRSYTDLREATKDAVRNMITYLGVEKKLDKVEAYMLCSVAADLRLHEVVSNSCPLRPLAFLWRLQVDMPNYVVRDLHLDA